MAENKTLINRKKAIPIGIKHIDVGFTTDTAIESKTIAARPKSNWFFLDLETGADGGWFPGSTTYGILYENRSTFIWDSPSEKSNIIATVKNIELKISTVLDDTKINWVAVEYSVNNLKRTGYARISDIKQTVYR